MSGRIRKDLAAAFLRLRIVLPAIVLILSTALILWLLRRH
jgi:hypothetical protein